MDSVASNASEKLELGRGLHALGDNFYIESARDIDHTGNDSGDLLIIDHLLDERLVDFKYINREVTQVRQ